MKSAEDVVSKFQQSWHLNTQASYQDLAVKQTFYYSVNMYIQTAKCNQHLNQHITHTIPFPKLNRSDKIIM